MPTTSAGRRPRLLAVLVALLAAAATLSGCAASSGSGGGTDPAGLVPASAPIYLEAVVHADDQEAGDARAALAKILRTNDPGAELVQLVDRGGRRKGITFREDIEPWLGDRLGVGVLSFAARRSDAVVVAASTDDAKARAALDKLQQGAAKRTYRDVDYTVDARRGSAAGVFGGAAVLGSETALKAAIDASKGDSLAEADALKTARGAVTQERSGFAYLDVARTVRQAVGAAGDDAVQVAPFLEPVTQALPKTIAAALDAEPDLLRIDSAALGQPSAGTPAGSGADALAALPADAWLGAGAGDLGRTLSNVLDSIASGGGLAGVGVEAVLNQIRQTTGLDVRRDVLGWMGDASVFVSGTTPDTAAGALTIGSKDPAATRRTVQLLRRLVASQGNDVGTLSAPGVDEGFSIRGRGDRDLLVAAGGDRFVVATGRDALRDALSPGADRLGDAAAFKDAASKLGGGVRPSFYLDVQRLVALMDAKHAGKADRAREYLEAFGVVTGGAKRDGDTTRGRAIATLR